MHTNSILWDQETGQEFGVEHIFDQLESQNTSLLAALLDTLDEKVTQVLKCILRFTSV